MDNNGNMDGQMVGWFDSRLCTQGTAKSDTNITAKYLLLWRMTGYVFLIRCSLCTVVIKGA
jgi:hypothetical protein